MAYNSTHTGAQIDAAVETINTALPSIREVPFTLYTSDWTLNQEGFYETTFETPYVTASSHDFLEWTRSIENATDGIEDMKAYDGANVIGRKFITRRIPAGSVSGTITPIDNADGKIAVVLEQTVIPIENGGTGANTLAEAKQNLGITEINTRLLPLAMQMDLLLNHTYRVVYTPSTNTSANVRFIGEGFSSADDYDFTFDMGGPIDDVHYPDATNKQLRITYTKDANSINFTIVTVFNQNQPYVLTVTIIPKNYELT